MKTTHRPPRWRVQLVRDGAAPAFPAETIRSSIDVARAFQTLVSRDREEFWVAATDQRHCIVGTHQVSVGTLSSSLVHPREVTKFLVLTSAAAAVFVHNHPSGDPTPSAEDEAITRRLIHVCSVLGIRVLDHVIVSHRGHYSFSDDGRMTGIDGSS